MTSLIETINKLHDPLFNWHYDIKKIKVSDADISFEIYDFDFNEYTRKYVVKNTFSVTISLYDFFKSGENIIKATIDDIENKRSSEYSNRKDEIKRKCEKVHKMLKDLNDDSREVQAAIYTVSYPHIF